MKQKAVFLDRDGTINRDVNYCRTVEAFEILPGVPEAIKQLNRHGFKVIVITNQSGVARGYFTEKELAEIHRYMQAELLKAGARIDAVYYCPHHPDENCDCRKPQPKMILQAVHEYNIDTGLSYMIGDDPKDVAAGKNAGCKTILLTGEQSGYGQTAADYEAANLLEAAKWIISQA